jgi:hypothetical protein
MFLYGTNITSDHVTGVKVQMSQGIALVKPTSCHIFSFIAGEINLRTLQQKLKSLCEYYR